MSNDDNTPANDDSQDQLAAYKKLLALKAANAASDKAIEPDVDESNAPPRDLGVSIFPTLRATAQGASDLAGAANKAIGKAYDYADTVGGIMPKYNDPSALDILNPEMGAIHAAALPAVLSRIGGLAEGAADVGRAARAAEALQEAPKAAAAAEELVPVFSSAGKRMAKIVTDPEAQKKLALELSPVLQYIASKKK